MHQLSTIHLALVDLRKSKININPVKHSKGITLHPSRAKQQLSSSYLFFLKQPYVLQSFGVSSGGKDLIKLSLQCLALTQGPAYTYTYTKKLNRSHDTTAVPDNFSVSNTLYIQTLSHETSMQFHYL